MVTSNNSTEAAPYFRRLDIEETVMYVNDPEAFLFVDTVNNTELQV